MKKAKNKYKYVVGYPGDNQCVYGKEIIEIKPNADIKRWATPMTLYQAKRALKRLRSFDEGLIFELVAVNPTKEEK